MTLPDPETLAPDVPLSPEAWRHVATVLADLRQNGARFVFLHGSQADGTAREGSDIDLAAHFGGAPVDLPALVSRLPAGIDLLVLDRAPLEMAGRVATSGRLLWEADPAERVRWQADTRKIWFDEKPRIAQARRDFLAAQRKRRGG